MIAEKTIKRLKNRVLIDLLFNKGKTVSSGVLVVHYLRGLGKVDDLFIGVGVSKRNMFLAVNRNVIKRQLRAAITINQVYIEKTMSAGLYMVLFKSKKKLNSSEINSCLLKAFEKISATPLNT
jgi:ribonuclease P protein component